MYCEKCSRVFKGYSPQCPVCSSKKLREPRRDDQCFLVEKLAIWGDMLADVLTRNEIPFVKTPVLGAGMTLKLGRGMERYRFYVLYAQLEEAKALTEQLFPSVPEE